MIHQGDRRWHVFPIAEQRSDSPGWSLVFCFRSPGHRPLWIAAQRNVPSKAAVYHHADRVSNDVLLDLLTTAAGEEAPA